MRFWGNKKNLQVKRTSTMVEPEEILSDVHNLAGFSIESHEGRLEVRLSRVIYVAAIVVFSLGLLVFEGRAAYLMLVRGKEFFKLSEQNRIDLVISPAPRGAIFDRQGREIASSQPGFSLVLAKDYLPSSADEKEKVFKILSQLATIPEEEIQNALATSNGSYTLLESNLDRDVALVLKNRSDELPGVFVEERSVRSYLAPQEFSHLVGYVGKPSKEDLQVFPDFNALELVGKGGLERAYERWLHGTPGKQLIEVDSRGKPHEQVLTQKPVAGNQLMLEVDMDLQKKLSEVLDRIRHVFSATGGAAIVLDYTTGAVLAEVSSPSFDPNLFIQGGNSSELQDVLTQKENPLFNRAVLGMYPPGSSIKPFIASAALEEHVIDPKMKIRTPLAIYVPNEYNPKIVYRFPDWRDHGYLDMVGGIEWSSNVYFYTIGGGYEKVKGLGIDRIVEWLKKFGFGQRVVLDAPVEAGGFIPTPQWKENVRHEPWTLGDTYHVSIGQGDLLVTPMQIAAATQAIANYGTIWGPRVVQKVVSPDGKVLQQHKPEAFASSLVFPDSLKVVREGMKKAVREGTVSTFFTFDGPIYGKSGSAQTGPKSKIYSWFTGFLDQPELPITITVMLEGGAGGDRTAAPVAREVLEWYLKQKGITPGPYKS